MKRKVMALTLITVLFFSTTAVGDAGHEFIEYAENPVVAPPESGFFYSPDILVENSSLWYMLFGGQATGTPANGDAIYIAYSTDGGNTWNQQGGASMILSDGPPNSWNDAHSNYPSWTKLANGTYVMVFTGAYGPGGNETDQIGIATSNNPIKGWTEYSGNPILAERYSHEEYNIARPSLLYEEGIFKMWYDCRATPYNY